MNYIPPAGIGIVIYRDNVVCMYRPPYRMCPITYDMQVGRVYFVDRLCPYKLKYWYYVEYR
jgi:hypothetical protein